MKLIGSKSKTLVIGAGAAGLAAALRLDELNEEAIVVTESVFDSVSLNAGSDKQTYYKLGVCGATPDSPRALAETYVQSGGADGDVALVESANSLRAFMRLVELGVPFPHDAYGQYAGYKTDHDPCCRATSCGPYTSREMCKALLAEIKSRDITVYDGRVAVQLLATPALEPSDGTEPPRRRILGAVFVNKHNRSLEAIKAENVILATGGPGGLYARSVYPECHTGAIGLALELGAVARGLPESQFGLASFTRLEGRKFKLEIGPENGLKEFRWNVSGTYMQCLPRFISTTSDGGDEREFLRAYFPSPSAMNDMVFLKGYQWPFDARKAIGGSSLIDLCVFYETEVLGRRVFLDFRSDPGDFRFDELGAEAREYLERSHARVSTPLARLQKMNPNAITLYRDYGIDLKKERLEIGVCAQHNNGGLAVDSRYRSLNIDGLFAIGETAGVHGVARPGGSALNSGQVGALRVAELLAHKKARSSKSEENQFMDEVTNATIAICATLRHARENALDWRAERLEFQKRMSERGGLFRSADAVRAAIQDADRQLKRILPEQFTGVDDHEREISKSEVEILRTVQLCVAHRVYLQSILSEVEAGVGSRGSQITLDPNGDAISPQLPEQWRMAPEDEAFRRQAFFAYALRNEPANEFAVHTFTRPTVPIPEPDEWFENVWREYRAGKNFQ